jgi:hypothetical protein
VECALTLFEQYENCCVGTEYVVNPQLESVLKSVALISEHARVLGVRGRKRNRSLLRLSA